METKMETLRKIARENARELVEKNTDRYNKLAHLSHNHIWIEVYPDGSVVEAEEASIQTRHYIKYPDKEVASILEIARCEYCDCDACASYGHTANNNFVQHLRNCEAYDYDMADRAAEAINAIEIGYFEDEVK